MFNTPACSDLEVMCRRLKLTKLSSRLEEFLKAARKAKLAPAQVLEQALQLEISCREEKRIELNMNLARFPAIKTLEDFDFSAVPALDRSQIDELAKLEWLRNASNVLFLGPPGVGKTHLALALGRLAVLAGYSTTFIMATALLKDLEEGVAKGTLDSKLMKYAKPKLLIIDEIGYLQVKPSTAYLFFQVISNRYERTSIIFTGNRPVSEWGLVFGDPTATSAILDRALHHCEIVTIRGDSYRMLAKRRAGLLNSGGIVAAQASEGDVMQAAEALQADVV